MMDAVQHADKAFTAERLFSWHAALFPTGRSGIVPITVATWRTSTQPMQVVSGAMGKEKEHYKAPASEVVPDEMDKFLRHPEGILFKNMIDYRSELIGIYNKITKYEDFNRIESSIDALVDPTRNAINEKCSRIREAFVSQLSDDIAENYYITGYRLTPKSIKLDRGLVEYKY